MSTEGLNQRDVCYPVDDSKEDELALCGRNLRHSHKSLFIYCGRAEFDLIAELSATSSRYPVHCI